eukprot:scaffold29960_cov126-Isochrysis_galbana.AAC.2
MARALCDTGGLTMSSWVEHHLHKIVAIHHKQKNRKDMQAMEFPRELTSASADEVMSISSYASDLSAA